MNKWEVKLTKKAETELKRLLSKRAISREDVKVILRWTDEMEEFGPEYIEKSKEWYDHALDRDWIGFRSSAFSYSGRIIYKIVDRRIIVEVHRITAEHDYKKRP